MSETAQKYLQMLKRKPVEPEQPEDPDERDVAIEHLERAIADERENAARLRKTVDELRFQIKTLETSYAKQLEDARQRVTDAERKNEEEKARTAGVEQERDETLHALKEAEAKIERLSAGADLMASMDSRPGIGVRAGEDAMSIDELLADSGPAPEAAKPDAESATEPEEPLEDMLSPELVLPSKGSD